MDILAVVYIISRFLYAHDDELLDTTTSSLLCIRYRVRMYRHLSCNSSTSSALSSHKGGEGTHIQQLDFPQWPMFRVDGDLLHDV